VVDDRLPRPKINVYAYSATAERDRFVVIGGRKYHEGDRLQDGPAIRRIEESAVTLDFEGQTYRVPRP
jgi:general secretion pathway protein B